MAKWFRRGLIGTGAALAVIIGLASLPVRTFPDDLADALAVAVTRDLATDWNVQSLRPHFATKSWDLLDKAQAQALAQTMRPLGALKSVGTPEAVYTWQKSGLFSVAQGRPAD